MQLYFIRHAQSANNLLWDKTGSGKGRSCDPALTDVGQQQARYLADFLLQGNPGLSWNGRDAQNVAGFGLTHLYTSLMLRAVETGMILAEKLGLPLTAWPDLHEGGGIYLDDDQENPVGQPGNNREYFESHYPKLGLPDTLGPDGWWNRPFEPREDRPVRARRLLDELHDRHGGTEHRVAVIGHGGFYNHILAVLLNLPTKEGYWFVLNNAAITRIDFPGEWIDVVYMNRAEFLPRDMIT